MKKKGNYKFSMYGTFNDNILAHTLNFVKEELKRGMLISRDSIIDTFLEMDEVSNITVPVMHIMNTITEFYCKEYKYSENISKEMRGLEKLMVRNVVCDIFNALKNCK